MTDTAIRQDLDADGVLLLTIDCPGLSMNVINEALTRDLIAAVERIRTDEAVKGAVITSGKASGFVAGADLKGMNFSGGGAGGQSSGKSRMAQLFEGVFTSRSAAGSRSFSPATTASSPTIRRSRSACRKYSSASSPARAAPSACRA